MAPTAPASITEWLVHWRHGAADVGEHVELLSDHLEFDGGLGVLDREDLLDMREIISGWTGLRVLALVASDTACAVTFEGKDPVTLLHHRLSWLVFFEDGKVRRIVETTMVVPSPERS